MDASPAHVWTVRRSRMSWGIAAVAIGVAAARLALVLTDPAEAGAVAGVKVPARDLVSVILELLLVASFGVTGALLASQKPRNPIGWLLLTTGMSFAMLAARRAPRLALPARRRRDHRPRGMVAVGRRLGLDSRRRSDLHLHPTAVPNGPAALAALAARAVGGDRSSSRSLLRLGRARARARSRTTPPSRARSATAEALHVATVGLARALRARRAAPRSPRSRCASSTPTASSASRSCGCGRRERCSW